MQQDGETSCVCWDITYLSGPWNTGELRECALVLAFIGAGSQPWSHPGQLGRIYRLSDYSGEVIKNIKTLKKSWDKTVLKMRSHIFEEKNVNFASNVLWKKWLFWKLYIITFEKKLFLKAKFRFFFIWDHIFKRFLSQDFFLLLFIVFCCRMKHKKLLKTEHQCTFVCIMNL